MIQFISVLLAFVLVFNSGLALAQTPPVSSPGIQEVESSRIAGQVVKVQGETATINTRDGIKQVNIPSDVSVTKNGNNIRPSDLQPGDGIVVTRTGQGEVLSVDAISGNVLDWTKWVFPVGVGILIIGLIAFLAWQRMRRDYIRTTGTKM